MAGLSVAELQLVLRTGPAGYTQQALDIAATELAGRSTDPPDTADHPQFPAPSPSGQRAWRSVVGFVVLWLAWALATGAFLLGLSALFLAKLDSALIGSVMLLLAVGLVLLARRLSSKWYRHLTAVAGIYALVSALQVARAFARSDSLSAHATERLVVGIFSFAAAVLLFILGHFLAPAIRRLRAADDGPSNPSLQRTPPG
jgi:hypothetical protein